MAPSKSPNPEQRILPHEPVQRFLQPISYFLHVEAASGIVLMLCTIIALVAANSAWAEPYEQFWKMKVGLQIGSFELKHYLKHWINDGLMVIFFFVIGLEVKREIVLGELRDFRRAMLPISAALGGMIIPAGLYLFMEWGQAESRGWGIPMATDIAFVVGCLAVLGSRVPATLRVLLLSLAIVDDIGAILVIALGYTESVQYSWLFGGVIGIGFVIVMQRVGVRSILAYTLLGFGIWLGFHESGIHATIAGVILGLMTPARPYLSHTLGGTLADRADRLFHGEEWVTQKYRAAQIAKYQRISRETVSPLEYLIYILHPWVAFVIMPVFALANAGVPIASADLTSHVAIAVMLGLVVGKPVGILLFCFLAKKLKITGFPEGIGWRQIVGGGFLAGIGFTMALFISGLALEDDALRAAKVGVLMGSFFCAVCGMTILGWQPNRMEEVMPDEDSTDTGTP